MVLKLQLSLSEENQRWDLDINTSAVVYSHQQRLQAQPLLDKTRFNQFITRIPTIQKANTQNEWNDIGTKAETPRIVRPLLFFVGIGTISFTLAAFMTVKETGAAVARAGKYTELIPAVRENLPFTIEGDENAYWGSLNEQDIRKLSQLGAFLRQRKRKAGIKRWCDTLDISNKTRKKFTKLSNRLLTLSPILKEEHRVTVPLIAFTTTIFTTVKICRTGIFGQNIITLMRRHLSQIPVANRLHTLTTSNFTHVRLGSLISNSFMISLIGGTYLTSKTFYTDKHGASNHSAEATSFFHFIAFCLVAGTFGRVSSQGFSRLLLIMRTRQIQNPKLISIIGKTPELGAAGITYGLLGMSISHAFTTGQLQNNKQLPFIGLSIPTLAIVLFSYNGALMSLTLLGVEAAFSINVAARIGGGLFGATYFYLGNDYWERLKQVFYEKDKRLQKALIHKNNIVSGIQSLEPFSFETIKQKIKDRKIKKLSLNKS